MGNPLSERIIDSIDQAAGLYHRLVLVVAPAGAGKTWALQEVVRNRGTTVVNVNLELSRRMLDLTVRQRALQVPRLLDEIVSQAAGEPVFLDNIEILFDVSLQQDPLRLLQGISRNRTIVAAWNGSVQNDWLVYAAPDHPECRRYPVKDLVLVCPELAA